MHPRAAVSAAAWQEIGNRWGIEKKTMDNFVKKMEKDRTYQAYLKHWDSRSGRGLSISAFLAAQPKMMKKVRGERVPVGTGEYHPLEEFKGRGFDELLRKLSDAGVKYIRTPEGDTDVENTQFCWEKSPGITGVSFFERDWKSLKGQDIDRATGLPPELSDEERDKITDEIFRQFRMK